MTTFDLTFARPAAFWLLAALPVFARVGLLLGVRRHRLPRAALWLRLAAVTLLALGLTEPLLTTGADAASTVFVVDRSRSASGEAADTATAWVTDALAGAGVTDRAAVIDFAASPSVTVPAGRARDLDRSWSAAPADTTNADYTNIESALALARSLPLGGKRRVVLVSDGAENVGTALNQAAQAAADGVPIDVVPLEGVGDRDLRVEGATAPTSAWLGEPVTVLASINSGIEGPGTVELWVDGARYASAKVDLTVGLASHAFKLTDLPAGFHALEVRISGPAGGDRYAENNVTPLSLVVRDQPKLLLISPEGSDPEVLSGALSRGGANVTVSLPADVPSRLSALGAYDAIVLDNVPADAMTLDQLAGLQEATRSLGRGLVVVGGTASYGPGAYAGSLLEETLPVTVRVTDGRERQRVALLLVMDKSGSMSYDPLGGAGKIEMAKEAVRQAARSLSDDDQIGVLVFNDKQEWVVQMTSVGDEAHRREIDEKIAAITADGGTEILPALNVGFDAIRNVDADVRHIVLLSDGKSRTGTRESYQKLIDDVVADRTTLSTIAIGNDADTDLLNFLADEGNGRYHFTDRAEEIPKLTLEEARSAGSQAVIRGAFRPIQKMPSPILANFAPDDLPNLDGYAFAEAKPDAQVILTSDRDDPILAKWQYGLGRVIAWTADTGTDFATEWPAWSGYDAFWTSMIRWSLPDPENRPVQLGVARDGPDAVVTVNSTDHAGEGGDPGTMTATITTPGGTTVPARALYRSGPNEWQMRITDPVPGAYQVQLQKASTGSGAPIDETAGFAIPPSPELQPAPDAATLLRALASRSGGRVLSLDAAPDAFDVVGTRGTPLRDYRPVWYVPVAFALLLLLAEIAIRMGVLTASRATFWRRR